MVTLTFDLDYDKMAAEGITEEDMLGPMREHAKIERYGITEISKGVFAAEGENALCSLMIFVIEKSEECTWYVRYLKSWRLERPNGGEELKWQIIKHYKKEGIPYYE